MSRTTNGGGSGEEVGMCPLERAYAHWREADLEGGCPLEGAGAARV